MLSMARPSALLGLVCLILLVGCRSPYHADQGALLGGGLGAATGAIVGSATGHPGAGAAIGAGVGAITGGAIGAGMDESEARNRALIEQRLGRQVAAGAVTLQEVVQMSRAGVADDLIVNHVRSHGMAAPLQSSDLIYLQQQGISQRVIEAMQTTPPAVAGPVAVPVYAAPPPAVIVEERWGPPCWHHPRPYYHSPGVHWGISVGH